MSGCEQISLPDLCVRFQDEETAKFFLNMLQSARANPTWVEGGTYYEVQLSQACKQAYIAFLKKNPLTSSFFKHSPQSANTPIIQGERFPVVGYQQLAWQGFSIYSQGSSLMDPNTNSTQQRLLLINTDDVSLQHVQVCEPSQQLIVNEDHAITLNSKDEQISLEARVSMHANGSASFIFSGEQTTRTAIDQWLTILGNMGIAQHHVDQIKFSQKYHGYDVCLPPHVFQQFCKIAELELSGDNDRISFNFYKCATVIHRLLQPRSILFSNEVQQYLKTTEPVDLSDKHTQYQPAETYPNGERIENNAAYNHGVSVTKIFRPLVNGLRRVKKSQHSLRHALMKKARAANNPLLADIPPTHPDVVVTDRVETNQPLLSLSPQREPVSQVRLSILEKDNDYQSLLAELKNLVALKHQAQSDTLIDLKIYEQVQKIRVKKNLLAHKNKATGMTEAHNEDILNICIANACLLICRPINPEAREKLMQGARGKGFTVKGKSSSFGPLAGYIPYDSRLSKISEHYQSRVATQPRRYQAQIDKYQAVNEDAHDMYRFSKRKLEQKFPNSWETVLNNQYHLAYLDTLFKRKDAHLKYHDMQKLDIALQALKKMPPVVKIWLKDPQSGKEVLVVEEADGAIVFDHDEPVFIAMTTPGVWQRYNKDTKLFDLPYQVSAERVVKPVEVMAYREFELNNGRLSDKHTPITADYDMLTVAARMISLFQQEQQLHISSFDLFDLLVHKKTPEEYVRQVIVNNAKLDLKQREESHFHAGLGSISEFERTLVTELAEVTGGAINHAPETSNPMPEQFSEESYAAFLPDGRIELLQSEQAICDLINVWRKKGIPLKVNPKWGWEVDESTGDLYIPAVRFDWQAVYERMTVIEGLRKVSTHHLQADLPLLKNQAYKITTLKQQSSQTLTEGEKSWLALAEAMWDDAIIQGFLEIKMLQLAPPLSYVDTLTGFLAGLNHLNSDSPHTLMGRTFINTTLQQYISRFGQGKAETFSAEQWIDFYSDPLQLETAFEQLMPWHHTLEASKASIIAACQAEISAKQAALSEAMQQYRLLFGKACTISQQLEAPQVSQLPQASQAPYCPQPAEQVANPHLTYYREMVTTSSQQEENLKQPLLSEISVKPSVGF